VDRQLAIEVDGGGNADAHTASHDLDRTSWLKRNGVDELHFWNSEINVNLEGVLQRILDALNVAPSPGPEMPARPLPWGEAS